MVKKKVKNPKVTTDIKNSSIQKKRNDKTFLQTVKQMFSTDIVITTKNDKSFKVDSILDKDFKKHSKTVFDNEERISTLLYGKSDTNDFSLNMSFSDEDSEIKLRQTRYSEFDNMDTDPIISSALDIYADEATTRNDAGEVLRISSDNEYIVEALHILFYNVLDIETNLWGWTRNAIKKGDHTLLLNVTNGYGITNFHSIEPGRIDRVEDLKNKGLDTHYIIDDNKKRRVEEFEIAHFRMISETRNYPYGTSILRGALHHWQSLKLMEDAMLIHRVTRAPERRIFKVDVGNLKPDDAKAHIQQVRNSIKKTPVINSKTGKYNLKYNIMNMMDDFFVTKRGNKYGTEIDTLSGLSGIDISDLEYMQNKLFAALKVPKSFLTYEETMNSKTTLAAEDERFSRTIERIQRSLITPVLYKMAKLHLYSLGIDEVDINNFKLSLNEPSIIREQLKLDLLSTRMNLIRDVKDSKMLSVKWAYKNIFEMSEKESKEQQKEVLNDLYMAYRFEQMEQDGTETTIKPKPPEKEDDYSSDNSDLNKNRITEKLHIEKIEKIKQLTFESQYTEMYKAYKHWTNKNKVLKS